MSVLPVLWMFALGQHPTDPGPAGCEDIQRIELSRTRLVPQKVCVSPGLLTGFVFEAPVSVEVQEELRFEEVSRGRASISVMPPRDMTPGERLRLSARYVDGRLPEEAVTLILVAAPGQATRQVEVFRDTRTRDSFEHELRQERANRQRLVQELERLRLDLERVHQQYTDPHSLQGLIVSGSMTREGLPAKTLKKSLIGHREHTLTLTAGTVYRSRQRIAIELWLMDSSSNPWKLFGARIKSSQDELLELVSFWQQGRFEPNVPFLLVVEFEAPTLGDPAECSVALFDDHDTRFSVAGVELP